MEGIEKLLVCLIKLEFFDFFLHNLFFYFSNQTILATVLISLVATPTPRRLPLPLAAPNTPSTRFQNHFHSNTLILEANDYLRRKWSMLLGPLPIRFRRLRPVLDPRRPIHPPILQHLR